MLDAAAEEFDHEELSRNTAGREDTNREITTRTNPMGLLPCLRRGSDRWWLPRSSEATEALGLLILSAGRGKGIDAPTHARVQRTLESDPPLLIFAALSWPGTRVNTGELVDWLAQHVTQRFANGDAFLGVPPITATTVQRWNKLRDHFRTLPIQRWLEDAALWLEVTGPQVSNTWRQQWPQVDLQTNGPVGVIQPPTNCLLQQLARLAQRQRSLDQSFDDQLQKSKLGAIKQLAYGLSHEINNPLANISTRAQQLQRGEQNSARHATLQRIIDQVYRAHEMIADLMFYANPPEAILQPTDLKQVIEQVADDFREETERQDIRLEISAQEHPLVTQVDAKMIYEAIRALVRNAIEAIGCQGTIVISLVQEQNHLTIHVADSGPGLSEQARQHAFDPYFSGREAGRGLGLGLCRAYRIAKLHHGDIRLVGGPAGCVATITLPQS
jgi:signal transduction histidine kinase